MSSPESCPNGISLDSATAATVRLRKVDPQRYGVPVHEERVIGEEGGKVGALPENAIAAQRGMVVQIEPKMEVQTAQVVPPLDLQEVEKETPPEVLEEASKAQDAIKASVDDPAVMEWKTGVPNPDAEIITLGTGSALPSKYRNVSATLVRVPGWGNILLDCGENTLGQLKRVFPPHELDEVLKGLRVLVISHMHADHHLGTAAVLKAWYQTVHAGVPASPPDPSKPVQDLLGPDQPQRLAVISEPAMQHWIQEYNALEDIGLSRLAPLTISPATPARGITSRLTWFTPPSELAHLSKEATRARIAATTIPPSLIGLRDAQAVLVTHCHGARALALTLPSGFKVSYSGDCRPSQAFSQIGRGSTVVIHEATFDDELAGDAVAKNHSTTSEALGVAEGMGARGCVLTHFSQRYQKMPVLEYAPGASASETAKGVVVGGEGEDGEQDEEEEGEDPEYALSDDDAAQTFPDQPTTNNGTPASSATSTYKPMPAAPDPDPDPDPTQPIVRYTLRTNMAVAVAFDYMRVRVGELWQMEKFTPALQRLFAEEKQKGGDGEGNGGEALVGGGEGGKKGKGKEKASLKGKRSRESGLR